MTGAPESSNVTATSAAALAARSRRTTAGSGGTPEEFGAFLRAEHTKISRIVREARIPME